MAKGFWKRVQSVIADSDIVLEILDARFPQETRNENIEESVSRKGKGLVLVINKSDLIGKKKALREKKALSKIAPTVFLSAKERLGARLLRTEIGKLAKGKKARIGLLGYPNTGKSSIINMLRGRRVAPTSRTAGFTRGEKLVKISENIMLIDTPGIIPFEEKDEFELALLTAKSPERMKDVEGTGERMVEWLQKEAAGEIERVYGVNEKGDGLDVLERIAEAKKRMMKGARPDIHWAAEQVIKDWQQGKIRAR